MIWREREHESHDLDVANDLATIQALRNYGLLKFFWLLSIRVQLELLEYLVNTWDILIQCFRLGAHILSIQVEEIFFLTYLSRNGPPISLFFTRMGNDIIKDYIVANCRPLSHPIKDGKINIKDVE